MAARRVDALQVGRILKEPQAAEGLAIHLAQLCVDPGLKAQATAFAHRHAESGGDQAVAAITRAINITQEKTDCHTANGSEKVGVRSGAFS